jgi:lipopolysaccharide transport system ATP-binding protein
MGCFLRRILGERLVIVCAVIDFVGHLMSDSVIRVENLGKRYTLGRQQEGRQYRALRDSIAGGAKSIAKRLTGRGAAVDGSREDFWALRDVSFEIKQGDRVGIIGRNGAGKSTLLKVLSRIVEPTTGQIGIKGRVASLLEVGTGFHPELTGRENIYLNGAILGMSRAEVVRKFDEIVAFAEVEKFLDTPVKRYSSGMYVRLAFAVAAHLEPEILIIDEVLAVGDAQFQQKCMGKMEDVSREGRTVLFVSHNIATMNQLCNKGIFLAAGKVVGTGTMGNVVSQYLTRGINDLPVLDLTVKSKQSAHKKKVFFDKISIKNNDHEFANELDVRYPFSVQIEYTVQQVVSNLELSVRIYRNDGIPVLTSCQSDSLVSATRRDRGRYEAIVEVPGMFLMPGSYSMSVAAHEPMVEMFDECKHVLPFNVLETGTRLAKYNHHQEVGVVIPIFDWKEKCLTPSLDAIC